MESETKPGISVIDFTKEKLKPGTESWFSTREKVRNAFEEYGCFQAVFDKVSPELHNSIFAVAEELFGLPTETKKQKTTDHVGFGYVGQSSSIPLYESLGIDNPTSPEEAQHFTNIMWPQGNNKFRESVDSFAKAVEELYRTTTRMVFESYGLERLYDAHMESTFYHFRFSKYRTRQRNETELGLYPHTDKTFISILHQNQVNGLQVKTKDGFWIDVDLSSPSSFLVIAGDILMAWSNERVWASEHQVVIEEEKATRYSTVFSSFIQGVISVPEELVDENFPLKYKPINHFDFFRFYYTQSRGGTKFSCPAIKVYCGV